MFMRNQVLYESWVIYWQIGDSSPPRGIYDEKLKTLMAWFSILVMSLKQIVELSQGTAWWQRSAIRRKLCNPLLAPKRLCVAQNMKGFCLNKNDQGKQGSGHSFIESVFFEHLLYAMHYSSHIGPTYDSRKEANYKWQWVLWWNLTG